MGKTRSRSRSIGLSKSKTTSDSKYVHQYKNEMAGSEDDGSGPTLDGVNVALTDHQYYTDSNLDWSFLSLSHNMVKLLADDYQDLTKKKSRRKSSRQVSERSPSFFPNLRNRKSSTINRTIVGSSHSHQGLVDDVRLKDIEDWSFNIFHINELSKGYAVMCVTQEIFRRHKLMQKFRIEQSKFDEFVTQVSRHYKRIPFHNSCHAADVLQTVNCLILNTGFTSIMTDLEIFCILITALVHDIEHTGTNNNFHKNSGSEMAKLYVVSVLENHHLRVGLGMLWKYELLNGLSASDTQDFKFMLTSMILCTDMVYHFQLINNMKILLETPVRCHSRIRIRRIMMLILHAADISNPAKPWDIHKIWVALLCEEFFRQGEKERGLNLPLSSNCDKNTANIATLQMGFISTFLKETFEVMDKLMEKDINECGGMYTYYQPWAVCIRSNMIMWRGQWRFLKYEFINKLFEETADPRKSIPVKNHLQKKKKRRSPGMCLCCNCSKKEFSMFNELSSTTMTM